jgi:hypothetical protein
MQIIRCTQKLLRELKFTANIEENAKSEPMGGWHANLFRIERRKCVIFTNDKTLFTLFVPGLRKPEFDHFDELFRQYLFKGLLNEGFSQSKIESVLNEHQTIIWQNE